MIRPQRRSLRCPGRLVGLAIPLLLLAGCAVGPDYQRPETPMTDAFKEFDGWKAATPADTIHRGAWWDTYGDPQLSALEERVSVSNQNLLAAEAQFRQARAVVGTARAALFPQAAIGVSFSRSHQSATLHNNLGGSGTDVSDYAMPLSINWELDLWGRIRRNVESNEANAQAFAADVESARLSLQAELAADYFQLRSVDADRAIFDDSITAFERSLKLTRSRYEGGIASRDDIAQAQTQLESTRAQAIDLGVQRAALENAIAVLIGEPPAKLSLPPMPLDAEPPSIPVGVPSQLLERRPDVAAAERAVAAANAQIGVAIAAYYPTVTLSASGGLESSHIDQWFTWPSRFYSVGPAVSETIYDGGFRASQTDAARAQYDNTVAGYRQSVLTAFQQVEDNMAALRVLADEAAVNAVAVAAARQSVDLTTNRYKEGAASYLDVVITQAAALNNERNANDVRGRRMVASVQLIQALGGGWDASTLPTPAELVAEDN
ncbi:MAG TPA: efflux transporter outer membrane subunit [Candidatus Dormibacteraeota bacterium]|nr:efflux transporter outer membrane subunit [Candidatus Dormibacteraeota bacterium]